MVEHELHFISQQSESKHLESKSYRPQLKTGSSSDRVNNLFHQSVHADQNNKKVELHKRKASNLVSGTLYQGF